MIGDYQLNIELPKKKRVFSDRLDRSVKVVEGRYPLYLPKEPYLTQFKEAYPNHSNEELKEITHCSKCYNSRIGNFLGLSKDPKWMEKEQNKNSRLAWTGAKNKRNYPPKGVIPPHLKQYLYGTATNKKQRKWTDEEKKKLSEFRKEQFRMEKLRVSWGLPQKTKLKVTAKGHRRISYLWIVRHKYTYEEVEEGVFVYDADTKRGLIMESHHKYGIKFYSREEWNEIKRKEDERKIV